MSGAIHFSHIDVRRMPGFPRGGLAVHGLVEGINVVYGPNASGKTTLARAMQRLLRPHAEGRPTDSLTAELVVAGQSFDLDYHLGQITCRSGGQEVPVPALAPAEVGQRYVLALHDLVQQEDDRDIVERIIQEAAGGYDVPAAAQGLGFDRDRPSGRNNRAVRDYDESVRDRKAAEDRLVGIDHDAQRLADLERQRSEAYEAQLRQKVLKDAIDAISKKDGLAHAQGAVAAFPESMSNFVGDEWQRLTDLKKKLAGFREKLAQENLSLVEAKREIAATSLPQDGVSAELVLTLQGRCETLRDRAADISRLTCDLAKVEKELSRALERLGPEVSPERAEVLQPAMLDKLFAFVRQAEEQRLEGEAAGRLANWLKVVPSVSESPDTLQEGMAFVEQQEQGLQLPLIFDETLGNSDEQRARKIIEAAVEIARSGRQVFYFTAQHDELGKWRRVLREIDDITHCEFDLARLRGLSEVEHAPEVLDFEPPRSPPIPVPEQDDWIAYGRLLNVSPLDRSGQVGGVHLWYVVSNVHELHRLLSHDINQ